MTRVWIWTVLIGLVLGGALVYHVAREFLSTLPDDIRHSLRATARKNVRPLGVAGVILVWTLIFALYSISLPAPSSSSSSQLVAQPSGNGSVDAGAQPAVSGSTGNAAGPGGGISATTAGRTTPATAGSAPAAPSGVSTGAPVERSIRPAGLFSGKANTRGIAAHSITLCGHAPLILGPLINTKPEDLLAYFKYVNDHGGVRGRTLNVTLEDDQYSADHSVAAAQTCKEKNPFMIFGALGSDVIPPVRQWAEQNKELYLYGFSAKAGTEKLRYSYGLSISQEDLSTLAARQASLRFPKAKIGMVWRNSDNFQPGHDAFKRELARHGKTLDADLKTTQDQGNYSQEIIELEQRNIGVVFILDDAFSQLGFMRQAKSAQYNPNFFVFPYNLHAQTLKDDALNPPIQGAHIAPAYTCHQYGGPYASYAAEIKVFEAAYAKYSPNTDLCSVAGDVAWQSWAAERVLVAMIDSCGLHCTRDLFAGMLLGGWKARIGAACPLDFSIDGHHGGFYADWLKAWRLNGNAAIYTDHRCLGTR
jgi:branched-chain amino acid transport system substrate-binding protein